MARYNFISLYYSAMSIEALKIEGHVLLKYVQHLVTKIIHQSSLNMWTIVMMYSLKRGYIPAHYHAVNISQILYCCMRHLLANYMPVIL